MLKLIIYNPEKIKHMPINMSIEYPKLQNENMKLRIVNDSLLNALKDCVVVMDRAREILKRDGSNWGMLDTKITKEEIKKAEQ